MAISSFGFLELSGIFFQVFSPEKYFEYFEFMGVNPVDMEGQLYTGIEQLN